MSGCGKRLASIRPLFGMDMMTDDSREKTKEEKKPRKPAATSDAIAPPASEAEKSDDERPQSQKIVTDGTDG